MSIGTGGGFKQVTGTHGTTLMQTTYNVLYPQGLFSSDETIAAAAAIHTSGKVAAPTTSIVGGDDYVSDMHNTKFMVFNLSSIVNKMFTDPKFGGLGKPYDVESLSIGVSTKLTYISSLNSDFGGYRVVILNLPVGLSGNLPEKYANGESGEKAHTFSMISGKTSQMFAPLINSCEYFTEFDGAVDSQDFAIHMRGKLRSSATATDNSMNFQLLNAKLDEPENEEIPIAIAKAKGSPVQRVTGGDGGIYLVLIPKDIEMFESQYTAHIIAKFNIAKETTVSSPANAYGVRHTVTHIKSGYDAALKVGISGSSTGKKKQHKHHAKKSKKHKRSGKKHGKKHRRSGKKHRRSKKHAADGGPSKKEQRKFIKHLARAAKKAKRNKQGQFVKSKRRKAKK